MEVYKCLICGQDAVIVILSVEMQHAPLCLVHWRDYCLDAPSLARDEVDKYFADGQPRDRAAVVPWHVEGRSSRKQTDEERPEYKTGKEDRR